jgi:excisionase family DNA binding protein
MLLKLNEVSQRLNCSLSNVYALVESGRLAAIPTGAGGAGLRVTEQDLAAFIDARRKARKPQSWPEKTNPHKLKHLC